MLPTADEVFADTELTLPQAGTLDAIGVWAGCTVAELSRRTPKTQQAISQLVAKLEKLGLVERRLGPRRGVGLYLTPEGEAARTDGNRREAELERRILERLGAAGTDELRRTLEQARAALSETRDE